MTKLFSMKSLAFAGAAAFALTLAVAPKADAAEATKITSLIPSQQVVDGDDGWGAYGAITIVTDGDLTNAGDGGVIYYQTAKSKDKIKEGKYTAISTHGYESTTSNKYSYNFDKFAGKATYISFSLDGVKEATGVAFKAQPKLKVKYTAADGFTYSVEGGSFSPLVTSAAVNSGHTEYVVGGDGNKYTIDGTEDTSWYLNFGGTLYFYATELDPTDGVAFSSKAAKVKVSAQPKAPKASLKLDATKAFTWKISNKQEYKIQVGDGTATKWATGSNNADDWSKIFATAKVTDAEAKVVTGDAITSDVVISLRTKADKKEASAITVIKLKKSAASPTTAAITVKTTKASGKAATQGAITASADVQYSFDGAAWKKLASGKTVTLKKDSEKTVYVRTAGESKTSNVLPSLNTKVEVDFNTGKANVTYLKYDDGDSVVADPQTPIEAQ